MLTLNFGKFNGQRLDQVSLNYLIWLSKCDTTEDEIGKNVKKFHPEVIDVVKKFFYHSGDVDMTYIFKFGKYTGKNINQIPLVYLFWLVECQDNNYSACLFVKANHPEAITAAVEFLTKKKNMALSVVQDTTQTVHNITQVVQAENKIDVEDDMEIIETDLVEENRQLREQLGKIRSKENVMKIVKHAVYNSKSKDIYTQILEQYL